MTGQRHFGLVKARADGQLFVTSRLSTEFRDRCICPECSQVAVETFRDMFSAFGQDPPATLTYVIVHPEKYEDEKYQTNISAMFQQQRSHRVANAFFQRFLDPNNTSFTEVDRVMIHSLFGSVLQSELGDARDAMKQILGHTDLLLASTNRGNRDPDARTREMYIEMLNGIAGESCHLPPHPQDGGPMPQNDQAPTTPLARPSVREPTEPLGINGKRRLASTNAEIESSLFGDSGDSDGEQQTECQTEWVCDRCSTAHTKTRCTTCAAAGYSSSRHMGQCLSGEKRENGEKGAQFDALASQTGQDGPSLPSMPMPMDLDDLDADESRSERGASEGGELPLQRVVRVWKAQRADGGGPVWEALRAQVAAMNLDSPSPRPRCNHSTLPAGEWCTICGRPPWEADAPGETRPVARSCDESLSGGQQHRAVLCRALCRARAHARAVLERESPASSESSDGSCLSGCNVISKCDGRHMSWQQMASARDAQAAHAENTVVHQNASSCDSAVVRFGGHVAHERHLAELPAFTQTQAEEWLSQCHDDSCHEESPTKAARHTADRRGTMK